MIEMWKDVQGFEGLYEVSNLGNVRKKGSQKNKVIEVNKRGYARVQLWKANKGKKYSVHRLVAMAFIPNTHNKPQVNHIDENKQNNKVTNLEWVTQTENHNHGTIRERISKSLTNNPKKSKAVAAYDDSGNMIFSFPSVYEAERQTKINNCTIRDCIHHRKGIKHAGGYIWRFI